MPVSSRKILFTGTGGSTVEVSPPQFGYRSTVSMALDVQRTENGIYTVYDHGAGAETYDVRLCECELLLSSAESTSFVAFILSPSAGRAVTCTLEGNANSGFHPFGPDKGNVGPFSVSMRIIDIEGYGDMPYQYHRYKIELINVSTYPAYTPSAQIAEGGVVIGTVSDLKYPQDRFKPHIEINTTIVHTESAVASYADRAYGDCKYTEFTMQCNQGNAAALVSYLTGTARNGAIALTVPTGSWAFGSNLGSGGTYATYLIQDKIEMTHDGFGQWSIPLRLAYTSGPT